MRSKSVTSAKSSGLRTAWEEVSSLLLTSSGQQLLLGKPRQSVTAEGWCGEMQLATQALKLSLRQTQMGLTSTRQSAAAFPYLRSVQPLSCRGSSRSAQQAESQLGHAGTVINEIERGSSAFAQLSVTGKKLSRSCGSRIWDIQHFVLCPFQLPVAFSSRILQQLNLHNNQTSSTVM